MSTTPINSDQWKARQRQEWDSVASGWSAWWQTVERSTQVVSDRLVALAEIEQGQRVLDIATGIGEPAVTAAHRVGPGGQVVAIDQAPQMLEIARKRAAALDLQNIQFIELNAENLDRLEGHFDAALCRWGLMLMPQLVPTLQGIRERLVPGGRFATSVWSTPARVPTMSLPLEVLRQFIEVPAPPPNTPGAFSLADSKVLEQAFIQAGWSSVSSSPLELIMELDSSRDYVSFMRAISPSFNALVASQSPEQQERIWQAIEDTTQKRYGSANEDVRIPAETICTLAVR